MHHNHRFIRVSLMTTGTHEAGNDLRNATLLININGELVPRERTMVSVFDSGFVLGDGVWEGLRVHHGCIAFLDEHLDRLFAGARALDLTPGLDRTALIERVYGTLEANGMRDASGKIR